MVLTSSSVTLMEEAQPSLSTRGEISRPCCCVGSQKIPVSLLVSFSSINKDFPLRREALPAFRLLSRVIGPDRRRLCRSLPELLDRRARSRKPDYFSRVRLMTETRFTGSKSPNVKTSVWETSVTYCLSPTM